MHYLFSSDPVTGLIYMLLSVPAVIMSFTMKGFGQALVSKWLGDPTPKENGRLTLNPLAHINWIGFAFMVLFGFGWTKEMPTNSRYYKNYKRDTVLYCLSGPLALIAMGFVMSFFYVLTVLLIQNPASFVEQGGYRIYTLNYISRAFLYLSLYPMLLAAFHLLPLPGLDGYKIITTFAPYRWNTFFYKVERYSMFIFIGFILLMQLGNLGYYIFYPARALFNGFTDLWRLLFNNETLNFLLDIFRQ